MHLSIWQIIALTAVITGLVTGTAASSLMSFATTGQPGYETITPGEAYDLLTDSSSLQIPVDVRMDGEWQSERIDTPYPEFPRHFALSRLDSQEGMETFKATYAGATVIVYCRSGGRSSTAAGLLDAAGFNGTVYNMQGGITAWKDQGYPTKIGNTHPGAPAAPQGPATVHAGTTATYTTSAVDPDDDPVRYGWDWDGDDGVDTWTDYRPSSVEGNVSHVWPTAGTYTAQVITFDHVGGWSSWTPFQVTVTNTRPEPPAIEGPSSGTTGQAYNYTFTVSDPDGDPLSLWIQWSGDDPDEEWLGPFSSGAEVTREHVWNRSGTYTIQAKTRDTGGMESDWATMQVSMPLTRMPLRGLLRVWLEFLFPWLALPG
ncbi:MAG: PKD domain-containing protein [Thermoplasmatota archaeon]